jgi:hypothetical protein
MKTYTILIDNREKRPLQFPEYLTIWNRGTLPTSPSKTTVRLLTRTATLPTGDYVLADSPTSCVIERKQDLRELHGNLVTETGRRRFLAELVRLQSFRHRILFLEGTPDTLMSKVPPEVTPEIVRDLLFHLLSTYQVELLLLPCQTANARLAAAQWIAARLIGEATSWPSPATPPPDPPSKSPKAESPSTPDSPPPSSSGTT